MRTGIHSEGCMVSTSFKQKLIIPNNFISGSVYLDLYGEVVTTNFEAEVVVFYRLQQKINLIICIG